MGRGLANVHAEFLGEYGLASQHARVLPEVGLAYNDAWIVFLLAIKPLNRIRARLLYVGKTANLSKILLVLRNKSHLRSWTDLERVDGLQKHSSLLNSGQIDEGVAEATKTISLGERGSGTKRLAGGRESLSAISCHVSLATLALFADQVHEQLSSHWAMPETFSEHFPSSASSASCKARCISLADA